MTTRFFIVLSIGLLILAWESSIEPANYYLNKGNAALFVEQDYIEAIHFYEMVLKLYPDHPTAWFNIGQVREEQDILLFAALAYDRALNAGFEPKRRVLNRLINIFTILDNPDQVRVYQDQLP